MTRKKSIKTKLLIGMIGLAAGICVLVGVASSFILYNESINNMNTRLHENADAYNQSVQHAIQTYKLSVEAIAQDTLITDPSLTKEEQNTRKSQLAQKYGFESVATADLSGNTSENTNIADRDYFQQAISGRTCISSTLVNKVSKKVVLNVATQVKNGSSFSGIVIGRVPSDQFSKMISSVAVGKSVYGFITDKE